MSERTSQDLDDLVEDWLELDEAADILGTSPNGIRQLVRDHELAAVSSASSRRPRVPALLLLDGEIVDGLRGTLTLLADARFSDAEAVAWIFTADETLPGRPVDALREGRGREVRRRAQALAF